MNVTRKAGQKMMDFLLHMLNIFSKIKLRARGIKYQEVKFILGKNFVSLEIQRT